MNYYVIRVAPRGEFKFSLMTKTLLEDSDAEIVIPRKKLTIQKQGKKFETEIPLFPGYVFLRIDTLDPKLYWELKKASGFLHYLKQGYRLSELTDRDLSLLKHFLSFGEVVDKSFVHFNEKNLIEVLSGPMQGLEGQIIKVDRRKKRARIQLNFNHASFHIDLGFEEMIQKEPQA